MVVWALRINMYIFFFFLFDFAIFYLISSSFFQGKSIIRKFNFYDLCLGFLFDGVINFFIEMFLGKIPNDQNWFNGFA